MLQPLQLFPIKTLLKFAVVLGLGFYLGKRFNQPQPNEAPAVVAQASQKQDSQCVVKQTVKTNADGSKEESTEFVAQVAQASDAKVELFPTPAVKPTPWGYGAMTDLKLQQGVVDAYYGFLRTGMIIRRDEQVFLIGIQINN